ncbi:hypothetical protein, partial [Corynebacterium glyciniphilum]|uniref:hypothetical protein n=1 Tax=Corynebacterium glyciniphilum TaxID=1404244 RepID=UPI0016431E2E
IGVVGEDVVEVVGVVGEEVIEVVGVVGVEGEEMGGESDGEVVDLWGGVRMWVEGVVVVVRGVVAVEGFVGEDEGDDVGGVDHEARGG